MTVKARIDGQKKESRARPLVEAGGVPIPLPPLDQLHGIDLPGGTLHRTATRDDSGFMSDDHVRRLEKLEVDVSVRPIVDPKSFALREHTHAPQTAPHDHPELLTAVAALTKAVEVLRAQVESLSRRPSFDPSLYAPADHDHPPRPLPRHEHAELVGKIDAVQKAVDGGKVSIAVNEIAVATLEDRLGSFSSSLEFARGLAERAVETSKPRQVDHGTLGGGRLHDSVSDRLAGFMTPELLSQLKQLWKERDRSGKG